MPGGWDGIGLQPEFIRACEELEWALPTDVQDEAIPLMLGGGDVMVARVRATAARELRRQPRLPTPHCSCPTTPRICMRCVLHRE